MSTFHRFFNSFVSFFKIFTSVPCAIAKTPPLAHAIHVCSYRIRYIVGLRNAYRHNSQTQSVSGRHGLYDFSQLKIIRCRTDKLYVSTAPAARA